MTKMAPVSGVNLVLAVALLVSACAAPTTSDGRPIDVTGTWIGAYTTTHGNSGRSMLVLRQDGESTTGTIQVTNLDPSFGAAPRPIQDGRLSGRTLEFKATGADGGIVSASLQVSADGRELGGPGRHLGLGYDAQVQFSHTKAN